MSALKIAAAIAAVALLADAAWLASIWDEPVYGGARLAAIEWSTRALMFGPVILAALTFWMWLRR